MGYLIDPDIIIHRGTISEADLRARLIAEAIEQAGWIGTDGKPIKGVSHTIRRGDGRSGGYSVEVIRDIRLSDQPRLGAPGGQIKEDGQ